MCVCVCVCACVIFTAFSHGAHSNTQPSWQRTRLTQGTLARVIIDEVATHLVIRAVVVDAVVDVYLALFAAEPGRTRALEVV